MLREREREKQADVVTWACFYGEQLRYHDTQQNDTEHNDIQHNDNHHIGLLCDAQHKRHSA